jgi:hypothetical protein
MEDDAATDWISMTVQPAWCGWYETLSADGRVKRYWKGCHWWSMTDPAYGFDTRLIQAPGTHWRGQRAPETGTRYAATESHRKPLPQ